MSDNVQRARELILHQIEELKKSPYLNNIVLLRNDIWHFAQNHCPITLYRYRPNKPYELDALVRNEIYLSQICEFEDQLDTFPSLCPDKIDEVIDSQCTESNIRMLVEEQFPWLSDEEKDQHCSIFTHWLTTKSYDDFKCQIKEKMRRRVDELRQRLRCACFTETSESEFMWNEYANNGKGFCLEYRLNFNMPECECDLFGPCGTNLVTSLLPVVYDGQAEIYQQSYVLAGYYDSWPIPSGEEHLVKLIMALHKRPQYRNEREWRLLAEDCGECEGNVFVKKSPSKIIIGPRCSDETRLCLKGIASELNIPIVDSICDRSPTVDVD